MNNKYKKFKATILCPQSYKYSCGFAHLLKSCLFQLADDFIKWCDISSESESQFKNALMLRYDILFIIHSSPKKKLQFLIKWFNPFEEKVQKFRAMFEDKFGKLRITFI